MITQIEIDGFKTFKDFKVELAPFQVIVGPNGSGKSNLFDALQLLSRLAEMDLRTAFQGLRGDIDELFTQIPGTSGSKQIRIAVEVFVNPKVDDGQGGELILTEDENKFLKEVYLQYTRLRYEVEIVYTANKLHITQETLQSIPSINDGWSEKYGSLQQSNQSLTTIDEQKTFIDTKLTTIAILESIADRSTVEAKQPLIYLYPDSDGQGRIKRFYTSEVNTTVLSRASYPEYPHALATKEELRALRFLHFNPDELRRPSSASALPSLSESGGNLPTTLARMQAEDQFALNDVSLDMASLVPDFTNVQVRKDDVRNEYTLWATYADGRTFSSRVLSDGTLQLLALATLKNDPQFHGVLCFEEPENGVNPAYLANIAHLLRGLATDFSDPSQREEPLRQVFVTTHSPAFITQPDTLNALLYMYTVMHVSPLATGIPPLRITQAAPVLVSGHITDTNIDKQEASYTLAFVRDLLANDHTGEAIERINQSRDLLNQN